MLEKHSFEVKNALSLGVVKPFFFFAFLQRMSRSSRGEEEEASHFVPFLDTQFHRTSDDGLALSIAVIRGLVSCAGVQVGRFERGSEKGRRRSTVSSPEKADVIKILGVFRMAGGMWQLLEKF